MSSPSGDAMTTRQTRAVLLTGFDPFGGDTINPSWEAVSRLHGEAIAGRRIVAAQLPTTFAGAPKVLRAALRRHAPDLVLCVGQAGGRAALSLERVAINVNDARIPDNAGAQPVDTPVVKRGPAAYFTTLPIKAMHADLHSAGIPAEISQAAGTFVCNQVFYVLMHALAGTRVRGGFVHIPYLPEQVKGSPGAPSLDLDTVVAGLRMCIETALRTRKDRRIGAGATH
jgi:pyroglutamyl-peptidase